MIEDEEGFEYPQIDENKCVRCYQCINYLIIVILKAVSPYEEFLSKTGIRT